MDIAKESLQKHREWKGKIETVVRAPVSSKEELMLAYTPGVASSCMAIHDDINQSFELTRRWNTVPVITDGTAVLGLGDIGPEAGMPVMEGKCALFKAFGGVDAFPICIKSKDVEKIINTIKLISGSFGGINLEDISAPRCFEIETRLKKELNIPVFHDDQHGTAIVIAAALINALKLVNKKIDEVEVVVNGAGAAGIGSGSGWDAVCGNIHLYGGTINACGGEGAAGIGSGQGGTCSSIEIEGGGITANGGDGAAGIGSGQYGSCGNIEIQGGEVSATGNGGGDDICAGYVGEFGIVTLPTPEGALSGLFSVSDDKQVRFSRGNLLSDGTFAANQYTYGDYFYASNSYNGPAGWDALTTDEWNYLYQHSTFGFATVNGIHGLIILPNNYSGSAITPYNPEDGSRELWGDNTYSGDAWAAMENNGVVFLPAAGYFDGDIQDQGYEGNYLTSSSGSFPVCFKFENQQALVWIGSAPWSTSINAYESGNSHYQYSVRLVRTE